MLDIEDIEAMGLGVEKEATDQDIKEEIGLSCFMKFQALRKPFGDYKALIQSDLIEAHSQLIKESKAGQEKSTCCPIE